MVETNDTDDAAVMELVEKTIPPMDLGNAEKLLREAKQIFDKHGVVFFLRQGTCLGAVRDHALIPWDDDLDLGSIIDMHGFTEDAIEPTVESFRAIGCYVEVHREGLYTDVAGSDNASPVRRSKVAPWRGHSTVSPSRSPSQSGPFPISLFTSLVEVDFIGDKYLVPSPPAEYLLYKYGPDWITPKQAGYEKDVLDNMPKGTVPGRAGKLSQFLAVHIFPSRTARLLVLDQKGEPVPDACVLIAGLNRCRTNRRGYAKFYLPGADNYAVAVTMGDNEEVLYEEAMAPGKSYVYRPDVNKSAGRYFVLTEE